MDGTVLTSGLGGGSLAKSTRRADRASVGGLSSGGTLGFFVTCFFTLVADVTIVALRPLLASFSASWMSNSDLDIDSICGFVENEDRGLPKECACERQSLFLTTTEGVAQTADRCVNSVTGHG